MAQGAKKKTSSASGGSRAKAKNAPPEKRSYEREIAGVACLLLALLTLIGCFNVEGWFIELFCGVLKGLLGWGCYIFPLALLASGWILFTHKGKPVRLRVVCVMLLPLVLGALLQLVLAKAEPDAAVGAFKFISSMYDGGKALKSGGVLAGMLGIGLKSAFSIYGAVPILLFVLLLLLTIAYNTTVGRMVKAVQARAEAKRVHQDKFARSQIQTAIDTFDVQDIPKGTVTGARIAPPAENDPTPVKRRRSAIDIPVDDDVAVDVLTMDEPAAQSAPVSEKKGFFAKIKGDKPASDKAPTDEVEPLSVTDAAKIAGVPVVETMGVSTADIKEDKKKTAEAVKAETENISRLIEERAAAQPGEYSFPPVELLRPASGAVVDGREEAELNRERLSTTLRSFGVSANVTDITRGPTVTRYDLELDAGVKLAKITNLAGDLALSLGVTGVRIAPIPDKISTVGIEVPNKIVSTVFLRDIVESANFRGAKSKLSFCIGKDIGGNCIVGNIAKLPHLLIAGTTGSGKSVCMNSLIISLLYKATPDEVRFIMIDPKMVELGIYNGIPHLYVPVVTDPKKAAGALQWAVVEMLKRYRLFSEVGVRDLATYNEYQKRNGGQTLPQVVTVIDELADLMLVASKEVEESICRVAQMGRAAGMHLVIATQRPSADVITGLMKANIPSRIAFAVSSSLESRIILDAPGAEKLIGMGDMLYAPLGVGKPLRVQGAFVSDEEREKIIEFIKSGSEAQYSEDILAQIEKAAAEKDKGGKAEPSRTEDEPGSDFDELLPQAVEVIFDVKQASVSMLQRRLKLGYSRAARIVDQMEEIGVVGPYEGSKPRQILVTREQWQEMQMRGGAEDRQEHMDLDGGAASDEEAPF
ncbi:MAG: DNA translocase FtsK [Candidatus Heteroscillospira sp.]|jgi:S-DNA-T family DNA segregation ATPase FtsK/SpoIIIE